ncbi:MAG: carboxypeptidase regulatory-like domain-containing protein, partial [Deltaproteobacteria bacterium]|nr:carboxypeptidase regulatory-like domain-containing protein [Deltaproteobacteria bacterium]
MSRALVLSVCLGACGGAADGVSDPDAPTANPCQVSISYEALPPFASPDTVVRAIANVTNSEGQHTYDWFLSFNGGSNMTPASASPDNSAVEFPATADGVYRVRFRIEDANCPEASQDIDINGPGVGTTAFRIRVVAPPDVDRPPLDKQVVVEGGDQDLLDDDVQLGPAVDASGTVTLGGTPVAGYLKFMPGVGADAVVETYANAVGQFSARLRAETHQVLVIPTTPDVPPQLVTFLAGQTSLALQAGTQVSGTVRDPQNVAIANATVQLSIGGVPSTIGTTDSTGAFSLVAPPATGLVRFEITAPAALGLPRLIGE